jgi:dolichol-phosphate hexosyltransferase
MYRNLEITVVIPCLNEEQGIAKVLSRMPSFVDEVIVVDNNSTDGTARIAAGMGARVIRENVRGYGRAYKTGLFHAKGDVIVTLDGDHSYPVDALSYLLEALLSARVGFVSASRFPIQSRDSMALLNLVGNRLLSIAMSCLYLTWIRDSQSGMWIFYKDVLSKMDLRSDGMAFSEEIKIEALCNPEIGFREIPINYSNRAGEKKLRPWKDGWNNLMFLLRKRIQLRPAGKRAVRVRET